MTVHKVTRKTVYHSLRLFSYEGPQSMQKLAKLSEVYLPVPVIKIRNQLKVPEQF